MNLSASERDRLGVAWSQRTPFAGSIPEVLRCFGTTMKEIGIRPDWRVSRQSATSDGRTHKGVISMLKFQFLQSNTGLNRAIAGAAVGGLLLAVAGACDARSEPGPFSALNGSWSGAGTIKKSNGASERIRCRSAFEPAGAASVSLHLRCASDSYNFDLTAGVAYQGGSISGSWQEATRNLGGGISGSSASDGRQVQVVAQTIGVTSNITLITRGNRQSVSITTPGAEVPEITVSLQRK